MKTISISGQKRDTTGSKSALRALRSEGFVPCELYGPNGNTSFTVFYADLKDLVYTAETYKVNIDIEGEAAEAIMKEIQFDPLNESILHIDFHAIEGNQEIKVNLPVKFSGTATGVREGGKLIKKLRKLTVKGIAKDMPDAIEVDISQLGLGKSIRVKDISTTLEVVNSPNLPLATVEVPRGLRGKEEATPAKK
jgi:large subunit ribosomal protein L25